MENNQIVKSSGELITRMSDILSVTNRLIARADERRNIVQLDDHQLFCKGLNGCILSKKPKWAITSFQHPDPTLAHILQSLELQEQIDLIITDINHPGLNGYEFAKKVRLGEAKYGSRIPIVVVSMVASYEVAMKGLEEHLFDACLPKNQSCDSIMHTIERILWQVGLVSNSGGYRQ